MPTTVTFNNKQIVEPGAYARVIGGVPTSNLASDTGTVLLIDTGVGQGYGGGAGFAGTSVQGLNAIYEFFDYPSFASWNRGGEMNQIVYKIFNPSKDYPGAQRLLYVQAKESNPATLTMTLTNGSIVMDTAAEGTGANGVIVSGNLRTGFAARLVAGTVNTSKFKLQVYKGAYEGVDADGELVGAGLEAQHLLVLESREVSTIGELREWASRNPTGNGYLSRLVINGLDTGAIVAGDVTTHSTLTAFAGGDEEYNATVIDNLIRAIDEVDYNFVLLTEFGVDDAIGLSNTKMFTALTETSLDMKFLIVAAGAGQNDLDGQSDSSFATAAYYNSDQVHVWHGAIQKLRRNGGFKTYSQLHGAALYVGLLAGLEPQVPATFKSVDVDKPVYELSLKQREAALKAGVVHLRDVRTRGWSINQDVNSKQDNEEQVQADGSTPEGSIARIKASLNRIIRQETELQFVGKPANEADPATIKNFVEKILVAQTASAAQPGLILKAFGVNVTFNNGDMFVEYQFVPNGPITRVFMTGVMLRVSFE